MPATVTDAMSLGYKKKNVRETQTDAVPADAIHNDLYSRKKDRTPKIGVEKPEANNRGKKKSIGLEIADARHVQYT